LIFEQQFQLPVANDIAILLYLCQLAMKLQILWFYRNMQNEMVNLSVASYRQFNFDKS